MAVRGQKKKAPTPDYNASLQERNFGRIYSSMFKSESYKALSIGAKQFYNVCRAQAFSELGRQCLFKYASSHGKTYNPENYFVLPASHLVEYGYKPSNACRYFSELEAAGFIEKVECNPHNHQCNVYAFSSKWKPKSFFLLSEK